MLTVALDEAGVFEAGVKASFFDSKTTLIGGVLYDDCGFDNDEKLERKRIEAYYRAVADLINNQNRNVNVTFPLDLHYKSFSPLENNKEKVKMMKTLINRTLSEFLAKGTFCGNHLYVEGEALPDRKGKYYVCAVAKTGRGKKDLISPGLGRFFSDDTASNTYYHMMSEAIEHFIFHNPFQHGDKHFKIDVATRSSANIGEDRQEEYELQGFISPKKANNRNEKFYYVMTADIFRSMLSERMMGALNKDISIDSFNVARTEYEIRNDMDVLDYVFFYMADSICSYLTFEIGTNDVGGVVQKAWELTGDNSLIFAYDEVDEYLKYSIRDVEVGNYYDALKRVFNFKASDNDSIAVMYNTKWRPFIENEVIKQLNAEKNHQDMSSVAFRELQKLRNTYMTNGLIPAESEYILEIFDKALNDDEDCSDKIKYYLNDIKVKAYCHKGDPKKSAQYMDECEKYAHAVDVEEYVRTRNQYATALCDSFEHDKAVSVFRDTVALVEGLSDLSRKVYGDKRKIHFGDLEYAKTLSLAGQCAAFLKDEESANLYFKKAIDLMEYDTANKKITESYYLHFLIDNDKSDEYVNGMIEYTDGVKGLSHQLTVILKKASEKEINLRFALYLYIKGLYVFYDKDSISEVWEQLKDIEHKLEDKEKKGHPWELIYKYYCLIAIEMGDKEAEKRYYNQLDKSKNKDIGPLVRVIALNSMAAIYRQRNEVEKAERVMGEIINELQKNYSVFSREDYKKTDKGDPDRWNLVSEKLNYMYD